MKINAIIFDFDGVIADTESAYLNSFNKLITKFNIKISRKEWFDRFPGTGTKYILSTIFKENKIDSKKNINYWLEKWKKEYSNYIEEGKIKLVRDFKKFNFDINKNKIKKIIATGSHKNNAFKVLKLYGLEKEFKIIGMEDVKRRKPSPDLFLYAAKKLNENPKNCLVFEDAIVGIRAAKKAKMKIIALSTSIKKEILKKEKPDLILENYKEIDIKKLTRKL